MSDNFILLKRAVLPMIVEIYQYTEVVQEDARKLSTTVSSADWKDSQHERLSFSMSQLVEAVCKNASTFNDHYQQLLKDLKEMCRGGH